MLPLVSKYIHKDIFITVYDLGFWMMVVIANGLSFLISPIGSNAFSLNYVWEKCRHILFLMIFSTFYIHSMNGNACEIYKVVLHIYKRIIKYLYLYAGVYDISYFLIILLRCIPHWRTFHFKAFLFPW